MEEHAMPPRKAPVDRAYLSRLQAIQGGPPPPGARALQTLKGLEDSLINQARESAAMRLRANRLAQQPNAPITDINMGEDVCRWKLFLQALCGFVFVRHECGQVNEASHTRIRTSCRHD